MTHIRFIASDYYACAILFYNQKILLQKDLIRRRPIMWKLPGGQSIISQDKCFPWRTAVREFEEETGISVVPKNPEPVFIKQPSTENVVHSFCFEVRLEHVFQDPRRIISKRFVYGLFTPETADDMIRNQEIVPVHAEAITEFLKRHI